MRIKDTKSATKSAMGCQGHQGCDQDYQGYHQGYQRCHQEYQGCHHGYQRCHQDYQDKLKQKLCEAQPRKKGA